MMPSAHSFAFLVALKLLILIVVSSRNGESGCKREEVAARNLGMQRSAGERSLNLFATWIAPRA